MTLPPDREAIEKEVADLFSNGDFTDIARLLHRDRSAVSRAFSIDDQTRLNPVSEIVAYLWAFDQLRDDLADLVLKLIEREREKGRPKPVRSVNPASLSGKVGRELIEAMESEIGETDYNEQISQWHDVEVAAREKKQHVINARNEFYQNGNLREFAASRVRQRA